MSRQGFQLNSSGGIRSRPQDISRLAAQAPYSWDELVMQPPEILKTAVIAEICKRSFPDFIRFAWPEVHGGRPMVEAWHLQVLAEHLQALWERRIERLGVNIPPGFGKSVIVSIMFPAWVWLQDPTTKILAVSGIEEVLIRDSMRLHYLVFGDWYRGTFAPPWTWHPSQNSKKSWSNTKGGSHVIRTTKQRITGIRADLILIDDPSDATEGYADKISLEETNEWYAGALSTRDDKDSRTNQGALWGLIMQRLAENDLTGWIQKNDPADWDWVVLPNEWDSEVRTSALGEYDPRRKPGELLFPWLVDEKKTKEIRARLGEDLYWAQYQQAPSPPGGSVFHEDLIRFWSQRTVPQNWDRMILSADLGGYRRKRNRRWQDPAVVQMWGAAGKGYYLLEQYRARDAGIAKVAEVILGWIEKNPHEINEIVIEDKAVGPELVEVLDQKLAGSGIRIVKSNPQGTSKLERAIAVQPLFEAGRVFFPHERYHGWVRRTLLPEILGFPKSHHDDQVDAMTQALLYLEKHGSGLQMYTLGRTTKRRQ